MTTNWQTKAELTRQYINVMNEHVNLLDQNIAIFEEKKRQILKELKIQERKLNEIDEDCLKNEDGELIPYAGFGYTIADCERNLRCLETNDFFDFICPNPLEYDDGCCQRTMKREEALQFWRELAENKKKQRELRLGRKV